MALFGPLTRIEHSKWFAPICEGATFAWRLITSRVSRAWNLFLLDERKSNRGVQMCHGSSQLKIKLVVNTRKDNLPINFCWSDYRQILSYNLSMLLKSMLRNLDSESVTLGNVSFLTNILLLHNQSRDLFFPRHAKSRCQRYKGNSIFQNIRKRVKSTNQYVGLFLEYYTGRHYTPVTPS